MTVKELKELIKDLPDNMEIFMDERLTDFTYGLVNSATVRKINFMEDVNGPVLSSYEVLVLSED